MKFCAFVTPGPSGTIKALSFAFRGLTWLPLLQLIFVVECFWRFILPFAFVLMIIFVFFFQVLHFMLSFFEAARSFVLDIGYGSSLLLKVPLSCFPVMMRFGRISTFTVFLFPKLIGRSSLFQLVDF